MRFVAVLVCVLASAACGDDGGGLSDGPPGPQVCTPPIGFTFQAIGDRSILNFGWTGLIHNVGVQDGTPFGVKVTKCDGCDGVCSFEGPTDPISPVNRRRCLNRMSRTCQVDTDCPNVAGEPRQCVYIYDSPVSSPLAGAGGLIGACGWSQIPIAAAGATPTVFGTLDQTTGDLNLQSLTVFLPLNGQGGTYRGNCAECIGDPIANDGKKEGTCVMGNRGQQQDPSPDIGQKCDVNRFGTLPGYEGSFSMDCSPTVKTTDGAGQVFGGTFSSSGFQISITAQSPNCTDPAFADEKCFCGVCSPESGMNKECTADSDCGPPPAKCGYLPPSCDPNPAPLTDAGTPNGAYSTMFAPHQCRGTGTTSYVTVGGHACQGPCNWNAETAKGTCRSKLNGAMVGCYPHGLGASIIAPGRRGKVGGVYIADTATARCNRITPSAAINGQLGLPGLNFQKRAFRIVPTEAPK